MRKIYIFLGLTFLSLLLFSQTNSHQVLKQKAEYYGNDQILSALNSNKTANQQNIWVHDSTHFYKGDGSNWTFNGRYRVLSRDNNGNMTTAEELIYNNSNQSWSNKLDISATYYNQNTTETYLEFPWNEQTQSWADTSKYYDYKQNGDFNLYFSRSWDTISHKFNYGYKFLLFYDTDDKLIYDKDFTWNENTQTWDLFQKWNYYYNNQDQINEEIIENWDTLNNQWINYEKINFHFDVNDYIISDTIRYWDSVYNNWYLYNNTQITNNTNGKPLSRITEVYDTLNQVWYNNQKNTLTYNNDGKITKTTTYNWSDGDWQNVAKTEYEYNINGLDSLITYYFWNINTNDWMYFNKYIFKYDNNNNSEELISKNWNSNTNQWENSSKNILFWNQYSTKRKILDQYNFILYPNPATNYINFNDPQLNNSAYIIYTNSGKKVKNGFIKNNKININNLKTGIYILEINSSKGKIVKKIIKN